MVARTLVVTIWAMTPLSATAGDELSDANNTTFDSSVVSLDNSQAGQTTFTIDADRTTIGWQDLQQPNSNTLEFDFTDANANSMVLNYIGAQHPSNLNGTVISNGTVAFSNPFGVFIGNEAVLDVGGLIAIGGDVSSQDFLTSQAMDVPLTGDVRNGGLIRADQNVLLLGRNVVNDGEILAEGGHVLMLGGDRIGLEDWDAIASDFLDPKNFEAILTSGTVSNNGSLSANDAALIGGRVTNYGEIAIADGSLLMMAADAVYVTTFDNPVLTRLPHASSTASPASGDASEAAGGDVEYAIENHGQIDAGLGHVRLAAADPLGFGIRQGTSDDRTAASISAKQIEIEGGETGRVHLSGTIDASDRSSDGVGGEIDITGSMIVLENAEVNASGTQGGGTIQIGGEQQGSGDLQRARVVIVDEESEVHADAIDRGDGGRVITFAEDLTSIDGELSARGGAAGGNGGFVETSGLKHFAISTLPDLRAPAGEGGTWLIDPYDITITNAAPDCPQDGISCLNKAVEAILSPNFDQAGFDGILRTVDPAENVANANYVSADLLARALSTGTDVALSTQEFGVVDNGPEVGNITLVDAISIDSADVLEGTTATLTLLAAGSILIGNDIEVLPFGGRSNLALTIVLRANDLNQLESDRTFDTDLLIGEVDIDADIRTGGGDFVASGIAVVQQAGRTIETSGGGVEILSGTLGQIYQPVTVQRTQSDPIVDPLTYDPRIEIAGSIDTRDSANPEDGGNIRLAANSMNIVTSARGDDPLQIVTGLLDLTGTLQTGGGDVELTGGTNLDNNGSVFAGSIDLTGSIDSAGGNVTLDANRVNPNGDNGSFAVSFVDPLRGEGGSIDIGAPITTGGGTLSIGSGRAQSIRIDADLNTTQADTSENGLVQIVALDTAGIEPDAGEYGYGEVVIGEISATNLTSAGIVVDSRTVTTGDAAGANGVNLVSIGSSTATLPNVTVEIAEVDPGTGELLGLDPSERIQVTGGREIVFNQNTALRASSILISAAAEPTELNDATPPGSERPFSETRLVFGGTNGAGQTASDGVRLNADTIAISIGDGTTPSDDLYSADLGTSADPTDFGLARLSRGSFDGLQLRNALGTFRPDNFALSQDGDLTITSGAATADGELDLAGAFDTAMNGLLGLLVALESSDGVLTIEDAAALNNGPGVQPGIDAGKSWVVLNGGLLLPDAPSSPPPSPETVPSPNSVVFGDGMTALGTGGTEAFDVEALTVSTPGDFSITQQIVDSISSVVDLVFTAGRDTGVAGAAGRGTLTVDAGLSLQADESLALRAGASGFGDLVFAGPATTLSANDLSLRAGGGTDSQNEDSTDRSQITGLQANVSLRDAGGGIFGDMASSAESFLYQQDAAIDAETDLPTLSQFGLVPGVGFRASGDVEYVVRSDYGTIDLDDGIPGTNEAEIFRNAALSLFAVQSGSTPALAVSSDFDFIGPKIEIGGIGDFTFTQSYADAFNRSGTDADEEMTLRAGLGGSGRLNFSSGVLVKAPRINLVSGDGVGGQTNSTIDVGSAMFDLSGPVGADKVFVYHIDEGFSVNDLPDDNQFVGGSPGLPDILAIRSDFGTMVLQNIDLTSLPLDLADPSGPGRLVLESESLTISRTDGANLELTTIPNLHLRLRANVLSLFAFVNNPGPVETGQVLAGPGPDDMNPIVGMDAAFDDESLLIEAFDSLASVATTENLSSLAEVPGMPGVFDLDIGLGPSALVIRQDGSVTVANLPVRDSISGRLRRSNLEEDDGTPAPTTYGIESFFGDVHVTPENVNGGRILLDATGANLASDSGVFFDLGTGTVPGFFDVENMLAVTLSSIFVPDGTTIRANDTISLTAALLGGPENDPGTDFGSIYFEDGPGTTALQANSVILIAGPTFVLDGPDLDNDGERDEVDDGDLPRIDFTGLDEISMVGDAADSAVRFRQSATLDMVRDGEGDFLTPIEAGSGPEKWNELEVSVIQGDLRMNELDVIASEVSNLIARTGPDSVLEIDIPDQSITAAPFDLFESARLVSNDMTFRTSDPATSINLANENLLLISNILRIGNETDDEALGLIDDPDTLLRPIVRIEQVADFTNTELPLPSQYRFLGFDSTATIVVNPANLDIQLETSGSSLTLDDAIRARTSFSNLILISGGDVDILLDGPTPGFGTLDYAALQLNTLDIRANGGTGSITIRPFMIDGVPTDLTLETAGDQQFDGQLVLESTFSTRGRDMTFTGDVTQNGAPDAGLLVGTSGHSVFEGDIGTRADPLARFYVSYDAGEQDDSPSLEFGSRDIDGTPVASDQNVWVRDDLLFVAYDFSEGDLTEDIEGAIVGVDDLSDLADQFRALNLGRISSPHYATIGKASGDLTFTSSDGEFVMASGEKLSVGGTATIDVDDGLAAIGDVSALDLVVVADSIGLVRRAAGITNDRSGQTNQDAGSTIAANTIDFGGVTPVAIGPGRGPAFGQPNPFDQTNLPSFLRNFPLFELQSSGQPFDVSQFRFLVSSGPLLTEVPLLRPTGSSRSDLSGAFGPEILPTPVRKIPHPYVLTDGERLLRLAVDAHRTAPFVLRSRLEGVAIIDDLAHPLPNQIAYVSDQRIDARDADAAIVLYEDLFGAEGQRTDEVRAILQGALDAYLENTRARRVIGFELRRFVKNRPSTLLEAYQTLESLEALFRYHRRFGLSDGEYQPIQRNWLRQIQPDGITVDELAEAIHPSRYVRGSDILDIFGR